VVCKEQGFVDYSLLFNEEFSTNRLGPAAGWEPGPPFDGMSDGANSSSTRLEPALRTCVNNAF
jgi:hypothetical protein